MQLTTTSWRAPQTEAACGAKERLSGASAPYAKNLWSTPCRESEYFSFPALMYPTKPVFTSLFASLTGSTAQLAKRHCILTPAEAAMSSTSVRPPRERTIWGWVLTRRQTKSVILYEPQVAIQDLLIHQHPPGTTKQCDHRALTAPRENTILSNRAVLGGRVGLEAAFATVERQHYLIDTALPGMLEATAKLPA